MNMKRLFNITAAIIIISILLTGRANAAAAPSLQDICSAALIKLDIMHINTKGSLKLKNKIKRCEFIAMVNSAMSYDPADAKDIKIKFKDISAKHWAYNDIKTAVGHDLINAYKDNTIRPDKNITNSEALDIMIRALGYGKTISAAQPEKVVEKAAELGLSNGAELPPGSLVTCGEASIMVYNALTVFFAE